MDAGQLRELVRAVLREELAHGAAPAPAAPRVESVALRTDGELMAFVHRLVQLADDRHSRGELESGRLVFRLAYGGPASLNRAPASPVGPAHADGPAWRHGLVTERHVEALEENIARLEVGATVRFTPLALDRLRQRGIRVKRVKT